MGGDIVDVTAIVLCQYLNMPGALSSLVTWHFFYQRGVYENYLRYGGDVWKVLHFDDKNENSIEFYWKYTWMKVSEKLGDGWTETMENIYSLDISTRLLPIYIKCQVPWCVTKLNFSLYQGG